MVLTTDAPVTLAGFAAAAAGPCALRLSPEARARLAAARSAVEAAAAGEAPVHGLDTGLGGNLAHRIAPDDMPAFQAQMLAGRRVGVGAAPEGLCRAAFLARILGLAKGRSGVSPAVVELMIATAARGLAPALPARGLIGAADLAMGAALGAALIGEGAIWRDGAPVPTPQALAAEVRLAARPAVIEAMPLSEGVEDVAPLTPLAAAGLEAVVAPFAWPTAVEARTAMQAMDLRTPAALGRVPAGLRERLRAAAPPLTEDRAAGPEVEAVRAALEAG